MDKNRTKGTEEIAMLVRFLFILLFPGLLFAQLQQKGNILSHIDSIIASMPSDIGDNAYQPPTSLQRAQFKNAFAAIFQKQYESASSTFSSNGYQLMLFEDTTAVPYISFYIIEKNKDSSHYWGTYVINPSPFRPAVAIQSPHELFDTKTGGQGAYVFYNTGALAFFLNGTHRCSSTASSSCAGTTTACSGISEPFKISDEAHNASGMFQAGTEAVLEYESGAVIVQLHGFGKGNGDPDVILGNGTAHMPNGTDYLVQFKNTLSMIDTSLTFKIAHIDTTWTELTGTTNTQGRLVNGSANPCSNKPTAATGRFLHIEQAYAKLRDTKTNWDKIVQAVQQTFPAVPVSVHREKNEIPRFGITQNYPNPFNSSTVISYQLPITNFVTLKVYDVIGREVATLVNEEKEAGNYSVKFSAEGGSASGGDASHLSSGIYFVRLQSGDKVQLKKMLMIK